MGLAKVDEWNFQWKMSFNTDPAKPVQGTIFNRKLKTIPQKLCLLYRILRNKLPGYLFKIIPTKLRVHNTKYCDDIPLLKVKRNYFRNSSWLLQ